MTQQDEDEQALFDAWWHEGVPALAISPGGPYTRVARIAFAAGRASLTTRAEAAERERDGLRKYLERILAMRIGVKTFSAAQAAFDLARELARDALSTPHP